MNLTDQTINQTVIVYDDILTGTSIGTLQKPFLLCEADYLRLRQADTWLSRWSQNIFFSAIGFGLSISPKFLAQISGQKERVSQQEWWVFLGTLGLGFVMYLVNLALPSEKKKTLTRIANHFDSAAKTRPFFRNKP
jgi:hypothetical protein